MERYEEGGGQTPNIMPVTAWGTGPGSECLAPQQRNLTTDGVIAEKIPEARTPPPQAQLRDSSVEEFLGFCLSSGCVRASLASSTRWGRDRGH